MKSDSGAGSREDRINRAITPIKPNPFYMTLMDDTPFETLHYEPSIGSDLSGRINRRLDFEESEEINLINKQEPQIENIRSKATFRRITPQRTHRCRYKCFNEKLFR